MMAEKLESSSKTSRRELKRRERKMWKKPIRFSGSDFTVDQIPVIFSGYTAESEDSSSSEMSDDSRTYSKSSEEEIDQESSKLKKMKSISRLSNMKVLRRQSTRKLSMGGLKKMRSMKRLTSNSRHILRKKNLDSISGEDLGLLEPHYFRPTSSSASKNIENIQKNLQVARLKRIKSLRYSGLLKATCSSAMKGSPSSKKSNDVCNYRYCSLHGRPHSHAADNSVSVPSLKRFVSMRRKFLKRQKSVNRRLVLLKRTLSRKRGPLGGRIVTDQESEQVDNDNADGESNQEEVSSSENCGNDSESNRGSTETVMMVVDDNVDGGMDLMETGAAGSKQCVQESKPETMDGMDLMETVASASKQCVQESKPETMDGGMDPMETGASATKQCVQESEPETMDGGMDPMDTGASATKQCVQESKPETMDGMDLMETVASATKQCVQESKPETMDGSDGRIDKDMEENTAQWHGICEQTVTVLDHDDGKVEETKVEETVGDDKEVFMEGSSGEMREEDEKKTETASNDKESNPEIIDDSDGRSDKDFKESKVAVLDSDNRKNTDNVWNDTVTLVKQAFDEILAEITDDDSSVGEDSSDSAGLDMHPIEARDTHLSVIVSTSHIGEDSDHKRGAKNWSYLKRVILLKRFLKSLDRKERHKCSDVEESETIMRLRRELVGEKKNAEEWMLDHALRQVISTLDPSQKRKVKHLVKAFESLNPIDTGSRGQDDLESLGREENETADTQTIIGESKDTEVLTGKDEALESIADSSSSHHLAVEEALDGLASSSSIEEKTERSEKQNLYTWRNLIHKHMILGDNNQRSDETEQEHKWSYGTEEDGDAATIKSFQQAFEKILAEIPDDEDEEIVLESSKEDHGQTKRSWNSVRKVILLKRFVKSLEKVQVFNPRKSRNLPVESELEAENVLLRQIMERRRTDGEELMLDYALRQAISRLAPIQRKKVELLVQAFDTVLDGHETLKQTKSDDTHKDEAVEEGTLRVDDDDCEVSKDEERIKNVFSRFQVHQKDLKQEVQAFDIVLDGHETLKQTKSSDTHKDEAAEEGTLRVEDDCEVSKDEQRIKNVFSRFQVHQKDLKQEVKDETAEEGTLRVEDDFEVSKDEQRIKNVFSRFQVHQKDLKQEVQVDEEGTLRVDEDSEVNKDKQKIANVFSRFQVHQGEEEVDSTLRKSRNLPPLVKQRIVVEKEKDSRMWKLIYKHMVTEKEGSANGKVDDEAGDLQDDARRSGTVALVREALEKILSEIPDNSSDDQSMDSDLTTDPEVSEEPITSKPKKGWNNVKKVVLLKRFVSDLGRLSPKTPRVLPWEPDPETEKIRLRHQEIGGKKNSEEWMLDYALRQAISTLAPSQKRKVSLLAQAFDTISLQDVGSATTSRTVSRQSSISSTVVLSDDIESNAEMIRGRLRNLQEDTKVDDLEEKKQCSSLWRLLCKQMEDNERNQTLSEETTKEDQDQEEGSKEVYQTEAVELLGEVIDGISLEESQDQKLIQKTEETLLVSQVKINRWSNLKRVITLRRFVKALENVRKFNPREPRFLPLDPDVEAEKVNLRHQETQNKRNGDEWMVDNALQEVVSKLTPARKLKVQLLVQAFESLSATGN